MAMKKRKFVYLIFRSINGQKPELLPGDFKRSNKVIFEKINYIHYNPVEEGLVFYPQDYVYSSARDYAGEKGLINNVIVVR